MLKMITMKVDEVVNEIRAQLQARLCESGLYEAAFIVRDQEIVIRGVSYIPNRHGELVKHLTSYDPENLTTDQLERMIAIAQETAAG